LYNHVIKYCAGVKRSWAGYTAHMEDKRNAYKVLIGKGEEKRQLRRPRHRRVYI